MYFFPRNNSFYSILITLNPLIRYLLTFFFMLLIFACWFYTIHKKFTKTEISFITDIENLRNKEKLLNDIRREINEIFLEVQNINNQIDIISNTNSNESENDGFDLLIKNAKLLNLTITSFNFDSCTLKKSYSKNIISFNFKGNFDQIIEFFKNLAFSQQWIKFKKINISTDTDNQIKVESICKIYTPKKGLKWQSKEFSINA